MPLGDKSFGCRRGPCYGRWERFNSLSSERHLPVGGPRGHPGNPNISLSLLLIVWAGTRWLGEVGHVSAGVSVCHLDTTKSSTG